MQCSAERKSGSETRGDLFNYEIKGIISNLLFNYENQVLKLTKKIEKRKKKKQQIELK
jgi:hypothetical protein